MQDFGYPVRGPLENLRKSLLQSFRKELKGSETLKEAWKLINKKYGSSRIQIKAIKQKL